MNAHRRKCAALTEKQRGRFHSKPWDQRPQGACADKCTLSKCRDMNGRDMNRKKLEEGRQSCATGGVPARVMRSPLQCAWDSGYRPIMFLSRLLPCYLIRYQSVGTNEIQRLEAMTPTLIFRPVSCLSPSPPFPSPRALLSAPRPPDHTFTLAHNPSSRGLGCSMFGMRI